MPAAIEDLALAIFNTQQVLAHWPTIASGSSSVMLWKDLECSECRHRGAAKCRSLVQIFAGFPFPQPHRRPKSPSFKDEEC